jgi:hypothetical protein
MEVLDLDQLHREAKWAYATHHSGSQKDLGDALGIDRSAVSRALRSSGLKHAAVQSRMLSFLKGCTVQRRSTFNGKDVHHEWVIDP